MNWEQKYVKPIDLVQISAFVTLSAPTLKKGDIFQKFSPPPFFTTPARSSIYIPHPLLYLVYSLDITFSFRRHVLKHIEEIPKISLSLKHPSCTENLHPGFLKNTYVGPISPTKVRIKKYISIHDSVKLTKTAVYGNEEWAQYRVNHQRLLSRLSKNQRISPEMKEQCSVFSFSK